MSHGRALVPRHLRRNSTRSEAVLWRALRGRQLEGFKFRRQHPVGRFVLDFYCPELRLAIEVDGGIHAEPARVASDESRDAVLLAEMDIRTIRIPAADVENELENVLARIGQMVNSAESPSPRGGEGARG